MLDKMSAAEQNGVDPAPVDPPSSGARAGATVVDKTAGTTEKSVGALTEKGVSSLRKQLAALKNDLQAERSRNTQIHRDKVAELKKVRATYDGERDRALETARVERAAELQRLRDRLQREKDAEIRQILRTREDEARRLRAEHSDEMASALVAATGAGRQRAEGVVQQRVEGVSAAAAALQRENDELRARLARAEMRHASENSSTARNVQRSESDRGTARFKAYRENHAGDAASDISSTGPWDEAPSNSGAFRSSGNFSETPSMERLGINAPPAGGLVEPPGAPEEASERRGSWLKLRGERASVVSQQSWINGDTGRAAPGVESVVNSWMELSLGGAASVGECGIESLENSFASWTHLELEGDADSLDGMSASRTISRAGSQAYNRADSRADSRAGGGVNSQAGGGVDGQTFSRTTSTVSDCRTLENKSERDVKESERQWQLQRRVVDLNAQMGQLEKRVLSLRDENELLKRKTEDQKASEEKVKQLKKRNAELAGIARRLEERLKQLQQEVSAKKVKETGEVEVTSAGRRLVRSLTRDLSDPTTALAEKDETIQRLRDKCRELLRQFQSSEDERLRTQELTMDQVKFDALLKQNAKERLLLEKQLVNQTHSAALEAQQLRCKALEEQNARLQQQVDQLTAQLGDMEKLEIEVVQRRIEVESLERQVEEARTRCTLLDGEMQRVTETNTQLSILNSDLQRRTDSLEAMSEDYETLKSRVDAVEREKEGAQTEVRRLNERVQTLQVELEYMQQAEQKRSVLEAEKQDMLERLRLKQLELDAIIQTKDEEGRKHEQSLADAQCRVEEFEAKCREQATSQRQLLEELSQSRRELISLPDLLALKRQGMQQIDEVDTSDVAMSEFVPSVGSTPIKSDDKGARNSASKTSQLEGRGIVGRPEEEKGIVGSSDEERGIVGSSEDKRGIVGSLEKATGGSGLRTVVSPEARQPGGAVEREVGGGGEGEDLRALLQVFQAVYSYDPSECSPNEQPDSELAIRTGDFIFVCGDMDEDGFYYGELMDGRRGLVPSNFIRQLSESELAEFYSAIGLDTPGGDPNHSALPALYDASYMDDSSHSIDDSPQAMVPPPQRPLLSNDSVEDSSFLSDAGYLQGSPEKSVPGVPEAPLNVQLETGPDHGSLMVSWLPVTIVETGRSNGVLVAGYCVLVDRRPVKRLLNPTGDHVLVESDDLIGLKSPRCVTVRTLSVEGVESADSLPELLPTHLLREMSPLVEISTANHVTDSDAKKLISDSEIPIEIVRRRSTLTRRTPPPNFNVDTIPAFNTSIGPNLAEEKLETTSVEQLQATGSELQPERVYQTSGNTLSPVASRKILEPGFIDAIAPRLQADEMGLIDQNSSLSTEASTAGVMPSMMTSASLAKVVNDSFATTLREDISPPTAAAEQGHGFSRNVHEETHNVVNCVVRIDPIDLCEPSNETSVLRLPDQDTKSSNDDSGALAGGFQPSSNSPNSSQATARLLVAEMEGLPANGMGKRRPWSGDPQQVLSTLATVDSPDVATAMDYMPASDEVVTADKVTLSMSADDVSDDAYTGARKYSQELTAAEEEEGTGGNEIDVGSMEAEETPRIGNTGAALIENERGFLKSSDKGARPDMQNDNAERHGDPVAFDANAANKSHHIESSTAISGVINTGDTSDTMPEPAANLSAIQLNSSLANGNASTAQGNNQASVNSIIDDLPSGASKFQPFMPGATNFRPVPAAATEFQPISSDSTEFVSLPSSTAFNSKPVEPLVRWNSNSLFRPVAAKAAVAPGGSAIQPMQGRIEPTQGQVEPSGRQVEDLMNKSGALVHGRTVTRGKMEHGGELLIQGSSSQGACPEAQAEGRIDGRGRRDRTASGGEVQSLRRRDELARRRLNGRGEDDESLRMSDTTSDEESDASASERDFSTLENVETSRRHRRNNDSNAESLVSARQHNSVDDVSEMELLDNNAVTSRRIRDDISDSDLIDYSDDGGESLVDSVAAGDGVGARVRLFISLFCYDPVTMSPNPDAANEELPFAEGQIIKIYGDKDEDGFYVGEASGRRGLVPCNMVSEIHVDDPDIAAQLLKETNHRPAGGVALANQSADSSRTTSRTSEFASRNHSAYSANTHDTRYDGGTSPGEGEGEEGEDVEPVCYMVALYNYNPNELSPNVDAEEELSFNKGDVIEIYGDMDEDGFYYGQLNGRRGLVPSNFLSDRPLSSGVRRQRVV